MVRKPAALVFGLVLLLISCSRSPIRSTASATPTLQPFGALTPYYTGTPVPATPTPTFVMTIPITPSPTSTPLLHTVTNDDTMMGLAFRYGVSLEALKTANPTVNPNAMSVGSKLVIPVDTEIPAQASTTTSLPVEAGATRCWPTGDGGAWCVAAVDNTTPGSLENISVWIGLFDASNQNFTSQVAYAPLDLLQPGGAMPVMAYFAPPLPAEFTARGELLTASAVAMGDARYLDATVQAEAVDIYPGGLQADVSGEVVLPQGSPAPSQVWLLVVAYDSGGNILGARKWKSDGDTHFAASVYSLGGSIDHVEYLSEVCP